MTNMTDLWTMIMTETPTEFIKIDNQTIVAQDFTKKPIQTYDAMVDVLKKEKKNQTY